MAQWHFHNFDYMHKKVQKTIFKQTDEKKNLYNDK